MKTGMKALALAVAMTLSGAAFAADAPTPPKPADGTEKPARPARMPGVRGKVTSTTATTIVVAGRGGEKTVTVDASTKYSLDGKEGASLADVKADMFVSATPETGTATEVKIMTKPPVRGGGRGPGGPGGKPPEAPKAPDAPKAEAK